MTTAEYQAARSHALEQADKLRKQGDDWLAMRTERLISEMDNLLSDRKEAS